MGQQEHKMCPWCGEPVVMLSYPSGMVLSDDVMRKSKRQFNPVCSDCSVTDLRVLIDVETEEEAWKQWDCQQ